MLNWGSFGIAKDESVRFAQPNSNSVTRFRATELLFGCANRTDSSLAMPKLPQLSTAFWLDWLTVSARPSPDTLAAPATTWPPVGRA